MYLIYMSVYFIHYTTVAEDRTLNGFFFLIYQNRMLIFKEKVVLHSGCAWNCNHFWTFDKETTTSELTAVLHQHGSGFFFLWTLFLLL